MALTNFIPTVWSAEMLFAFREQAIAANLVNRTYEGDATMGNTVRVTSGSAIAVKDYKAAGRTTSADAVTDSKVDLLIDQEKNFDFYVDDIDKAQAAGSMAGYTQDAGLGLAEDADKYLLAQAVGQAGTTLTASTLTTGDDAFNLVRDIRKALNKAHVPAGNRVLVCNAEFEALLLSASSKLTSSNVSGSPAGLRDASVGRVLNFDVYMSENMPNVAKPQVAAWYKPSLSYVSQINEVEGLRATDRFADRLRGLHVYGAKATRPSGIVTWLSI